MKNYQYAATSVAIPTKPAKWKTKGGQVISGTSSVGMPANENFINLNPGGQGTDSKAAKNVAKKMVKDMGVVFAELGDQEGKGGEGKGHKSSKNSGGAVVEAFGGRNNAGDPNNRPQLRLVEPRAAEDVKFLAKKPPGTLVKPNGTVVSDQMFNGMTLGEKIEAINATDMVNYGRLMAGEPKLDLDPSTTTAAQGRKAMQGKLGVTYSPEVTANLKQQGLLPEFGADGQLTTQSKDNFLQAQKENKIFLPQNDDPILSGGANPNFKHMNPEISDALAFGPSGPPTDAGDLVDGVDVPGLLGKIRKARAEYHSLVAQGVLQETYNFNPKKKTKTYNRGTVNGNVLGNQTSYEVSSQAIRMAAVSHATMELGPQKYDGAATQDTRMQGICFDDVNTMLNIKDPSQGFSDMQDQRVNGDQAKVLSVDHNASITFSSGGPDLTRGQRLGRAVQLDSKGQKTNVNNVPVNVRDQPRGALFVGRATSTGVINGHCGIIAPPNSQIPTKYNDAPRIDIFKCGVDTITLTGKNRNKNLIRRIQKDFKQVGETISEANIAGGTGGVSKTSWADATLSDAAISTEMWKVRATDAPGNRTPLFVDASNSNSAIDGHPPMKEMSVTKNGKTFKYQVLAPNVRMDSRKIRSKRNPNAGKTLIIDGKKHTFAMDCHGGGRGGSGGRNFPRVTCTGFHA